MHKPIPFEISLVWLLCNYKRNTSFVIEARILKDTKLNLIFLIEFQWKTLLSSMACCVVPSLHELTAEEVEAKLGIGKDTQKIKC